MPVDISALRCRLQHACPNDCQSLTSKDLVELKWNVKKQIFVGLMSKCSSLRDHYERLEILMEGRELELNSYRQSTINDGSIDRVERAEREGYFRTSFLRLILDALTSLRWPPALEAFSDPLEQLLHPVGDNSTIYDAFAFLLDYGMNLKSDPKDGFIARKNDGRDKLDISDLTIGTETYDNSNAQMNQYSNIKSKVATTNGRSSKNGSSSSYGLNSNNASLMTEVYGGNVFVNESVDMSISSSSSQHNADFAKSSAANQRRVNSASSTSSRYQDNVFHSDGSSYTSTHSKDYHSLAVAFEVIQHQNEVLSRQLRCMQESVCSREHAETRMNSLLFDLLASIDEIVSTANINNSQTTDDIRDDVSTHSTYQNRVKAPTMSRSRTDSSKTSGVIWSQLQSRIRDIKKQWDEASRDSRKSLFNDVKVHDSTMQFVEYASPPSGKQRQPTKRGGVSSQRERDANSSNNQLHAMKPSTYRIHQLLGVKPNFATESLSSDLYSIDQSQTIALDLPRVHLLQQDLIHFSEDAFKWLSLDQDSTNKTGKYDPAPCSLKASNTQQSLEVLRQRTHDLLIHMSSFAPVAPLSCNPPFSSSYTGLEMLIDEVMNKLPQRAKISRDTTLALQAACDRAKAEQVAVIRCLSQHQTKLKEYSHTSKQIAPKIQELGSRVTHRMDSFMTEIENLFGSIESIATAYRRAEADRIVDKTNKKQISPMASIMNGCLGEEMSHFMSTVKLNSGDLFHLVEKLHEFKSKIQIELKEEVGVFRSNKLNNL